MKMKFLPAVAVVLVSLPLAAHAQGTVRGAEEGAAAGERAAGPLGAIVGGTIWCGNRHCRRHLGR